jgi:SAM-dependent methyltransferase
MSVQEPSTFFASLWRALAKPSVFSSYTAEELWTDPHTSREMLKLHLDPDIDVSSRRAAFIERSVEWLVRNFQLSPGKQVLDFGCGPGLYTSRLAQCGAAVTGVDFSGTSIAYAKRQAEQSGQIISYEQANYLEYVPRGEFDLVTMIMCPEQRATMLQKFAGSLGEEGRCVFDVYSLEAFAQKQEAVVLEENLMNGFWSPSRYLGILATHKYEAPAVSLDKYTIVEEQRQRQVLNWIQYFSPESIRAERQQSGGGEAPGRCLRRALRSSGYRVRGGCTARVRRLRRTRCLRRA